MATGTSNLFQIDHIVVLMMENRSFDHMLGYLRNAGMPELNGLTGQESNPGPDGTVHAVFPFPPDQTAFHRPGQPFDKSQDPCHAPQCVAMQLADNNAGFVKNFVSTRAQPPAQPELVMGYYTAEHLPVYDYLARAYCVCDAWHSSIPGDTWPNRIYAMTGRPAPQVRLNVGILRSLLLRLLGVKLPSGLPIYDGRAFTRHLGKEQWRWYSHDPATLRGADPAYRDWKNPQAQNFGYFNRVSVSALTDALEEVFVDGNSFLDDAAKGTLPPLSWIDPNFIDVHVLDPTSNDDHPPSDIRAGQALVFDIYDTLVKSPNWENTMFVITYDEHGGFYDHVPPPPVSDGSGFATLGVRVPALVVGPRVRQLVSHQLFDHTALIKTILMRFAANAGQAIADMGPRVAQSPDLSLLLGGDVRPAPDYQAVRDQIEPWRQSSRAAHFANPHGVSQAPDGAGRQIVLNDFQREFLGYATALRRLLPPGHP